MKALYDVSEVTSGVFAPSDTFSYQSVGLWHNHIVYSTLRMFQHLGTNDPTLEQWLTYMENAVSIGEEKKVFPCGSISVINELTKIFRDAEAESESGREKQAICTCDPTIRKLMDLLTKTVYNPNFVNTPIVIPVSIAYYSAILLSQVKDADTGAKLSIPRWLKGTAADVAGGLSGAGFGFNFGPWGAVAGGIIGGAAGTIAAL